MKIQILDVKQGAANKQLGEQGIDISAVNGQEENIFSIEAEYMVFFRLTEIGEQTLEQVLSGNVALVEKLHEYSQIVVGVHLQMELNLTTIDSGMPIWEGEYIES